MKKILICISLLFTTSIIFAQNIQDQYDPFNIYYGRQPSAKAEGMGKGFVANTSNDFGAFYNPASTSLTKGLTAFASYSNRYYTDNNANYNYQGLSYNFDKIGTFGLSRYYIGSGLDRLIGDNFNYKLYTLNYSREVLSNFFAGVNVNLISAHQVPYVIFGEYDPYEEKSTASFDLGLIKKFEFKSDLLNRKEEIILGASMINMFGTRISVYGIDRDVPVIGRIGIGHSLNILKNNLVKNSHTFKIFTHAEFEKEFGHGNINMIKAGTDFTLFDIVSLRGGFYHSFKQQRASAKTNLTYGVGLNIPVDKFFDGKYPFKVNIDYVNLDQSNIERSSNYENFNLLSMKVNWIPE